MDFIDDSSLALLVYHDMEYKNCLNENVMKLIMYVIFNKEI